MEGQAFSRFHLYFNKRVVLCTWRLIILYLCAAGFLFTGCALDNSNTSDNVPEHDKRYGIYCNVRN